MEQSIDQQRLPGVREVCRDFAVLEDHSLAHNLQEQEIEHHLASNIQRTRLVQHDLVMAKQLQEEEDLRAQQRLKKRHKDLERQDCEIAQEIQEKLVIEADRRRRQEEKDEDIARLLQEELLKEEKKRKKQFSEPLVADDGSFHPAAGMRTRGSRDVAHVKPRVVVDDLQLDDAAIARRLQEEELRASQEDERAAQVAQDEEIARLFMEREKKAHRKPKSSEKMPHEKRRPEECNVEVNELGHSRSRDRQDQPRSRSDKPSRPPPPGAEIIADLENNRSFEKPSSSTRPFSKSESSPKGSYHRQ
ncbi:coiled-coil domain-containing protein 50 isoform X2 [Ambystoma mexicanum]|uniref:coiled-coil domain-containing protein 50 isoform X2 n=1 Tax=Ambystoma mexicanum TaxID=8296 RepID=UPI0037E8B061